MVYSTHPSIESPRIELRDSRSLSYDLFRVCLYDITLFEVDEAVDADAAFVTSLDLTHVILDSP